MQVIGSLYLQARTLALIFVAWAVLACLFALDWPQLAATLTATVVGYLGAARGGLGGIWGRSRCAVSAAAIGSSTVALGRPPKNYMN